MFLDNEEAIPARQKVLCKMKQTSVKGKGANQEAALLGHGAAYPGLPTRVLGGETVCTRSVNAVSRPGKAMVEPGVRRSGGPGT